jgi:hypothetical protein
MESSGKVMDALEADLSRDFLERIAGIHNQFLGFLNTISMKITPGRHSQSVLEMLAHMPFRPTDKSPNLGQVTFLDIVLPNVSDGLLDYQISRQFGRHRLVPCMVVTNFVLPEKKQQELCQLHVAQFAVEMALMLPLIPNSLEQVSNPLLATLEQITGGKKQLSEPSVLHQELDVQRFYRGGGA